MGADGGSDVGGGGNWGVADDHWRVANDGRGGQDGCWGGQDGGGQRGGQVGGVGGGQWGVEQGSGRGQQVAGLCARDGGHQECQGNKV